MMRIVPCSRSIRTTSKFILNHSWNSWSRTVTTKPPTTSTGTTGSSTSNSTSVHAILNQSLNDTNQLSTSQIAMAKFGSNTAENEANALKSIPASDYTSIMERQRRNEQAAINVFIGFTLVILSCQTYKLSVEKRNINEKLEEQKEYVKDIRNHIKEILESQKLQHIASMIVDTDDVTTTHPTKKQTGNWFRRSNNNSTSKSYNEQDRYDRIQQIRDILSKQLDILLGDIALDDDEKDSKYMQSLVSKNAVIIPRYLDEQTIDDNAGKSHSGSDDDDDDDTKSHTDIPSPSSTLSSSSIEAETTDQLLQVLQDENVQLDNNAPPNTKRKRIFTI